MTGILTVRDRCENVVRARLDRLTPRHLGRYEFVADTLVNDLSTALAEALQVMTSYSSVSDAALCAFMNARRG